MRIIGCDLHARQQAVAMLDTETGEVVNLMLKHEGDEVREFYSKLPRPVLVGIEATGSMKKPLDNGRTRRDIPLIGTLVILLPTIREAHRFGQEMSATRPSFFSLHW